MITAVSEEREPRAGAEHRVTRETDIEARIVIDGTGRARIETGLGFLNHMLDSFARHGLFDLEIQAKGDLHVDDHHTVEDVAIALGRALSKALGDGRGIRRMGWAMIPMDESLARVALDVSGRGVAVLDIPLDGPMVGDVKVQMVKHFFHSLALESRITLHVEVLHGENDHHKVEACFKGLAKALDWATQIDDRMAEQVPSTKGVL
jgi:imidazoleglycerol-phosphate dehydratase